MSVESLGELIRLANNAQQDDLHTTAPGKVISYDPATMYAQVQPTVMRIINTDADIPIYELMPVLPAVKVCFPNGGGTSITWPINPGDSVIVFFTEADAAQWLATGEIARPDIQKRHSMSSSFCLPCLTHDKAVLPSAVDSGMVLTAASIKLGSLSASDFVALASKVATELTALKTAYDVHTHSYLPGPGPAAPTAVPIPLFTAPGSVAATKVKAE